MAPIINEIGRKVSSAGKKSKKAVTDYFRIKKLKTQIAQEKGKIAAFYTEVGQVCYEQYSGDRDDQFADTFSRIRYCHDWIAELEQEIQKIRNIKICPNCGLTVEYWTLFCPKCGVAFPESPEEARAEENGDGFFCTGCGARMPGNTGFCTVCGQPTAAVEVKAPDPAVAAPITVFMPAPVPLTEEPKPQAAETVEAESAPQETETAGEAQAAEAPKTDGRKKRGRKPKSEAAADPEAQAAVSQETGGVPEQDEEAGDAAIPAEADGSGDTGGPAESEETRVCPNCGTALEPGGIFCSECRTRVDRA